MRLIDADALLETIRNSDYYDDSQIEDAPTVDAELVRHGKWIERTKVYPALFTDSTYIYECSNCGCMDTHGANVEVPYCWHCGAKMDGEKRENETD